MSKMIKHNLVQGSPEWHAHRAGHFNASDAPAMMNCSPHGTRDQLVKRIATGVEADEGGYKKHLDNGHHYEAMARPLAEELIDDDLFPMVGSRGELSASFDGLTMDHSINFEHKSLNDELREFFEKAERFFGSGVGSLPALPLHYRVQMEHQHIVSGAKKTLFMASKWGQDGAMVDEKHCWYESDPALCEMISIGWDQLKRDVAAYKHVEAPAAVVAAVVESLPAVSVRVDGKVALTSNLGLYMGKLKAYIADLPKKPATDQEFADAELGVKTLLSAQKACESSAENLLTQFSDVEEARRTLLDAAETCSKTRLALEKLVKQRKETIRIEILSSARDRLRDYVTALNGRLSRPFMPEVHDEFAEAIKGKRTVESLEKAVETELTKVKLEASAMADRIHVNLKFLAESGTPELLFPDLQSLCTKEVQHFTAVVIQRKSEDENRRREAEERERERIRTEELARIASEQKEEAKQEPVAKAEQPAQEQEVKPAAPASASRGTYWPANTEEVAAMKPAEHTRVERPTDMAIVMAIAGFFGVNSRVASGWIRTMDLDSLQ